MTEDRLVKTGPHSAASMQAILKGPTIDWSWHKGPIIGWIGYSEYLSRWERFLLWVDLRSVDDLARARWPHLFSIRAALRMEDNKI